MDGDTGKISDSEVEYAAYFTDIERLEYFKQYEGKIIRSIRITTKLSDLSGGSSRHQMVNWGIRAASNVAQAIHVDSYSVEYCHICSSKRVKSYGLRRWLRQKEYCDLINL
jgi:hypothetical protein